MGLLGDDDTQLAIAQGLLSGRGSAGLAAALGKDIIATANAVKRGRELIFSEVSIREKGSDKLIANGSMIYRIT